MEIKIIKDVEIIPITDIFPYGNNPRNNDTEIDNLVNSITEHGFSVPLEIDQNHTIITGHARYKAALRIGMTALPCIIRDDLTPEQVIARRIVDNKISDLASWDNDVLRKELERLPDFDWKAYGFYESELSSILGDFSAEDFSGLFVESPKKEKEAKKIQCPHCGEWFEI